MKKLHKLTLLYYYIRISSIIYLIGTILILITTFFDLKFQVIYRDIFIVIMFSCVPMLFIIQGIIYKRDSKKPFSFLNPDQIYYSAFLGVTIGWGPIIIYYLKYNKKIKLKFQQNKT